MRKRGMFFLLDAIVFAVILLGGLYLFPPQTPQHPIENPNSFLAYDILGVLGAMQMSEVNSTWVNQQIAAGNISELNRSVLIQLGAFWSQGNPGLANELLQQTAGKNLPSYLRYGVWFDDEVVYASSAPPQSFSVTGWKVISGLEKAKPINGFVANARANEVEGNYTMVVTISPEGSGWEDGRVDIIKYVNTTNLSITSATLILSVHTDTVAGDMRVNFNNGLCSYQRNALTWKYNDQGDVGNISVKNCLINGMNRINISLNNDNYNAHTHPGSQLIINYTGAGAVVLPEIKVSKRYYFDDITSIESGGDGSGVFATMPFFIPESAVNISVAAQIAGRNIRNYNYPTVAGCDIHYFYEPSTAQTSCDNFRSWDGSNRRARDYDYILFLNTNTPLDANASPATNVLYRYNHSRLASRLINGTNLISVYFNTYDDYVWGTGNPRLYSDPISDPQGSSYVEVNYTQLIDIPYGAIEISRIKEIGGSDNNDKTGSFTYPSEAVEIGESYIHIIQKLSDRVTQWAGIFNPPTAQIFTSPSSRAVPTSTYIDPQLFSRTLTNYVRSRDQGTSNDILSISNIEYHFFIPSYVGYGGVFATQAQAQADAQSRLEAAVGPYLTTSSITTETNEITQVPTLWGPTIVEVRVWG